MKKDNFSKTIQDMCGLKDVELEDKRLHELIDKAFLNKLTKEEKIEVCLLQKKRDKNR